MSKFQYIVRGREDDAALSDFLFSLQEQPEIELVDTFGPEGRPHTAVVAIDTDQASAFEQRFIHSPHLMIERDRPLSLFQ